LLILCLWSTATVHAWGQNTPDKTPPKELDKLPPPKSVEAEYQLPPNPPSILPDEMKPLDLASALRLAGVENPEILIARQRVVEATALQQLAAAQILPNINVGLNFDNHVGPLQQSSGAILKVNRGALYLGLGANAVAAGTVNVPGIYYNFNLSQAIFGFFISRQVARQREFDSVAARNDVLRRVATGYVELMRAEGQRAIAIQNRDQARVIAQLTADFVNVGVVKPSDVDRATTELLRRNDNVMEVEGRVLTASASLARLLNLDPSTPLAAIDGWVVPAPIVPDPIPLSQLIFIAMNQRPELASRRAAIREATLALRNAQLLPFSPNVIAGYSAGTFGGGSNLVSQLGGFGLFQQTRFGNFAPRDDIDVIAYWSAQNLGLGNLAQVRLQRSITGIRNQEHILALNQVRSEVATAYARTHARFGQIAIAESAVKSGERGYSEDLRRIRNNKGLPIELLDSFRLLSTARQQYLDAISDYNRAQFELYVALGQPPAAYLARPVPAKLVPPPAVPVCAPGASAQSVPPVGSRQPAH
jgi:outer membrane protein TolC